MTAHALLSSSKAHIWAHCLGAPALWQAYPQPREESEASKAGTTAASAAEAFGKAHERFDAGSQYEQLNQYLDVIYQAEAKYLDPVVEFESPRLKPLMIAANPLRGGTPDAIIWDRAGAGATIVDLKWGEGVRVEAVGNEQLIDYWWGLDLLMRKEGYPLDAQAKVDLVIVQPRWRDENDRVRRWAMSSDSARGRATHQSGSAGAIFDLLADGFHGSIRRTPGDHCLWCPAKGKTKPGSSEWLCPEQAAYALRALPDLDAIPAPSQVVGLSLTGQAMVLKHADEIRAWLNAVETHALAAAIADPAQTPPGFKVVAGKIGNRAWAKGVDEGAIAMAIKQIGVHPFGKPPLLSPTQVEKEAGGKGRMGKERMESLKAFISRAPGAPVLAEESDPRDRFDPTAALTALPPVEAPKRIGGCGDADWGQNGKPEATDWQITGNV